MTQSLAPAFRDAYLAFLAIPTRWMDNDVYGHVNNVTYYSYFDTVVNEHLVRAGGLDFRSAPALGVVVETACRFHKPLSFPEAIDAGLRVAHIGHSSVSYQIAIFAKATTMPRRPAASSTSGSIGEAGVRCGYRTRFAPRSSRCTRVSRAFTASAGEFAVNAIVECETMTTATRAQALQLLGRFLADDTHYRASAVHYGDGGLAALERALDLFLGRPGSASSGSHAPTASLRVHVSSVLRSPRRAEASSPSSTTSRSTRRDEGRASVRRCCRR